MKKSLRFFFATALLAAVAGGGFALAQVPAAGTADHASHHPASTPKAAGMGGATGQMGAGMDHGMMKGGGMMGHGHGGADDHGMMMGGGMCPLMMGGAATKVEVKKIDKGVIITMTSPDAATAVRLQKMAEGMRLMHEATTQ